MDGAQVQPTGEGILKFFRIINNARSGTAKGVTRTDAKWKSKLLRSFLAFQEALRCGLRRHGNIQFLHQRTKSLAVFCDFDGTDVHTNHANTVFLPQPHFIALDAKVQGRLPAHGG